MCGIRVGQGDCITLHAALCIQCTTPQSLFLPSLPCFPAPPSCPSTLPPTPSTCPFLQPLPLAPPHCLYSLPLSAAPPCPSLLFLPPALATCPSHLPLSPAPPNCSSPLPLPPHSPRSICDQSETQPDSGEAEERTPTGGSRNGTRFTAQEEGIRGVREQCGVG